jgi:multicomponent Na+:H+ antiporter subunit B
MERNNFIIGIIALVIVLGVGYFFYAMYTEQGPGVGLFDAKPEERDSAAYIEKSVSGSSTPVVSGRGGYENASANIVTAIVVDYRMIDTLGEVLVLFCASIGIVLLFKKDTPLQVDVKEASTISKTAVPLIMLLAVTFGMYIILHGHLTPGGGFPGGAVIASAFLLKILTFQKSIKIKRFKIAEALAGLGIIGVGILGLVLKDSLFHQFLPQGVVGETVSATGSVLIYILIGIKVASELTVIMDTLKKE